MKILNSIVEPQIQKGVNVEIKKFLHLLEVAFAYSPDRTTTPRYIIPDFADDDFIKHSTEIINELNKNFFESFYIDRWERKKIENYIPAKRLIILHGNTGVGKTVLSMKICKELRDIYNLDAVYFDWKSLGLSISTDCEDDFSRFIMKIVYSKLFDEYIMKSKKEIEDWREYRVLKDPDFISIREQIVSMYKKPLTPNGKWIALLDHSEIRKELIKLQSVSNLSLLIKFILKKHKVVLCFDNIDRFNLENQRGVLEFSIDLSNECQIPLIITIRTPSIRRLTENAAKGDFVFIEEIKGIQDFHEDQNQIFGLINEGEMISQEDAINRLLLNRINFLREQTTLSFIRNYFNNLHESITADLTFEVYIKEFMQILDSISSTFFKTEAIKYCNNNIREILILYSNFLNKIIINPDPNYSFQDLFLLKGQSRDTVLRTYFYKYLICGNNSFPQGVDLDSLDMNKYWLTIKLLLYLYNNEKENKGINIEDIINDFWRFNIERGSVYEIVEYLSKDQFFDENELIWVDEVKRGSDNSKQVFLMPAGKYFLQKFGLSREYIFWMILSSEFPREDVIFETLDSQIEYLKTNSDYFKLKLFYYHFNFHIVSEIEKEIEFLKTKFLVLPNVKESIYSLYFGHFNLDGKLFYERMVDSVANTIEYSKFKDTKEKEEIISNYQEIHKEIIRIKNLYETLI